jgi:hypothetical protein
MAALSPQQGLFIQYYLNPKSGTFSNATQSALKAGYSQEYANNITSQMPEWLSDMLGKRDRLILKAEKNLENLLDETDVRVKADMTKFTLSRLKKEEYSDRSEVTGKGGETLTINIVRNGDNNTI